MVAARSLLKIFGFMAIADEQEFCADIGSKRIYIFLMQKNMLS
jgi:hypothetical protein